METFRAAWADPDLKARILFVLAMFAVFIFGVHVPVPVPGVSTDQVAKLIEGNTGLGLINMFGGGALRRVSVFALSLGPYITAQIIMQILTTAFPQWKKDLQEGGEYARQVQNKRTRLLTLFLCVFQGAGLFALIEKSLGASATASTLIMTLSVVVIWTAGAMFVLWLGEQISEKGIGNGVSLMIFAGIILSMPFQFDRMRKGIEDGAVDWWRPVLMLLILIATTWVIVYFTVAQRRIPIQHMRRMVGTKVQGGQTSYLPLSVNMVGVIPIIFASSLLFIPQQIAMAVGPTSTVGAFLQNFQNWISPSSRQTWGPIQLPVNPVGVLSYTLMIFFFTYFYTAIQYNVEDIATNLKRGGSFIPGVRPGKQTKDFLDGVISRITFVGSFFLAVVALVQYLAPAIVGIDYTYVSYLGGTSLLIVVSVALETLRQIEANLLMKKYGQ
ncbi:MAG TPA: preprotein translocase subunit SecY [Fimbriimonadaceae bacterium]|nr:preprotein translocase subunit SecY [Fimbriimonadaceae bacterium]